MSYKQILQMCGVNYIGKVAQSAKMTYSLNKGTMTYCIYLAPSDISGYNVCPNSQHCKAHCLNGSGRNKAAILEQGFDSSRINLARIKKTKFFFEHRDLFMQAVIMEIERYRRQAAALGYDFSIRLNGTSDISPTLFVDSKTKKNLLQLYPNVMFYDYSKVPSRMVVAGRFDNYDMTFSYDGYNWSECDKYLKQGGKVAVVFYGELPQRFNGYEVINGNDDDMRYLNPNGVIIGLHYHVTANDFYINEATRKRERRKPNTPFVVMNDDIRCEF